MPDVELRTTFRRWTASMRMKVNAWGYDLSGARRYSSDAVFFIRLREGRVWGLVLRKGGRRAR